MSYDNNEAKLTTPEGEQSVPQRYVCSICGFVYDASEGMPDRGIAPGTPFSDLPEGWKCPVCGAKQEYFNAREKRKQE
jgi:rubredoxin